MEIFTGLNLVSSGRVHVAHNLRVCVSFFAYLSLAFSVCCFPSSEEGIKEMQSQMKLMLRIMLILNNYALLTKEPL